MDVLTELRDFYRELCNYRSYWSTFAARGLTRKESTEFSDLRDKLVRQTHNVRILVRDLTGKEKLQVIGKGPEYSYDMWQAAFKRKHDSNMRNALNICIDYTNQAIGKLEADIKRGLRDREGNLIKKPRKVDLKPPKAFIAHGGDSPALRKLESYLEALGIQPLVVEEQPSEGRSIAENVDWYARQADCAIILATKGDIDGKTGGFIPRGNVLIEIGKSQELFKERIIYLLQAGAKLPSNITEKVRARFTTQRMDDAFIKVAKELKKFGILKAVKPHPEEQKS